jgi:rare lipoprotein A
VPPALTAQALTPVGVAAELPANQPQPAATAATQTSTALRVRGSRLDVLRGESTTIAGRLLEDRHAGEAGRLVFLQALIGDRWRTLAGAHTRAGGRFRLSYAPRRLGSELVRVRFAGGRGVGGSHRRLGRLNVFRVVDASWYGGGGSLACGGALSSSTMGVANRTLPCGTLVTLRYGGRSVRVPVIDRGPYVEGREFDLTAATKQALGFGDTGEVWSTR